MTGVNPATGVPYRAENLKDTTDLYNAIATGTLPAVSYVKPSGLNDGHPESSKISTSSRTSCKKIVDAVQANPTAEERTQPSSSPMTRAAAIGIPATSSSSISSATARAFR